MKTANRRFIEDIAVSLSPRYQATYRQASRQLIGFAPEQTPQQHPSLRPNEVRIVLLGHIGVTAHAGSESVIAVDGVQDIEFVD